MVVGYPYFWKHPYQLMIKSGGLGPGGFGISDQLVGGMKFGHEFFIT